MRQTTILKKDTVDKKWYIIDATNNVVGRLASEVAMILRGKRKYNFTPNIDCGDNVIIINAKNIKFTGDKLNKKIYYSHSLYIGGLKKVVAKNLLNKFPERILKKAIKGMLPKTRLGKKQFKNLYVYSDSKHKHIAQLPIELKISTNKNNNVLNQRNNETDGK